MLPYGYADLPFARPRQSFERFGPLNLSFEDDVSHDQALIVIEHDTNFCRVDDLQSSADLKTIVEAMANGD